MSEIINNLNKVDRITEAKEFPAVVLLDNTSACNLKCSMCDHKNITNYRPIETMNMGLYAKIIDEIALENPNARIWEIFFGDPFLCKDMPERIKYAKDKGLTDVVVNTNGVLMTNDRAKAYIEAGLDAIYVGVDSFSSDIYDQIRIGGNYQKVVDNVLGYRDCLKSIGRSDQELFVQFVISDINEKEVEDFKRFWHDQGVKVKIRPKVSWAGLIEANNLRDNKDVKRMPCYWLMRTINICADGTAALCSVDLHCQVKCGNVNDSSIKELWCNGCLRDYRKMHLEGRWDELPALCKNCSDWQSAYADYLL